jgi:hypothetical protein
MRLAESIRRRIENSARWLARQHDMYDSLPDTFLKG